MVRKYSGTIIKKILRRGRGQEKGNLLNLGNRSGKTLNLRCLALPSRKMRLTRGVEASRWEFKGSSYSDCRESEQVLRKKPRLLVEKSHVPKERDEVEWFGAHN